MRTHIGLLGYNMMSLDGQNFVERVIIIGFHSNVFKTHQFYKKMQISIFASYELTFLGPGIMDIIKKVISRLPSDLLKQHLEH